jgi:hypothetical protein
MFLSYSVGKEIPYKHTARRTLESHLAGSGGNQHESKLVVATAWPMESAGARPVPGNSALRRCGARKQDLPNFLRSL